MPDSPDPRPMTFGETLRQLRRSASLTQRELASEAGIDFTYLSKIENDQDVPPKEETIRKLAAALQEDAEGLMALAGKMPRSLRDRASTDQRFAMFLRSLPNLPEEKLDELYRDAGIPDPE